MVPGGGGPAGRQHWRGGRAGSDCRGRASASLAALAVGRVADPSARGHAAQAAGYMAAALLATPAEDLAAVYAAQDARCGLPLPARAELGATCCPPWMGSAAAHAAAVARMTGRRADFAVFVEPSHAARLAGGWPQLAGGRGLALAWSTVVLACLRRDVATSALLRCWACYHAAVGALTLASPRSRQVLPPLHSRKEFLRFLLAVDPSRAAGWPAAVDAFAGRPHADALLFYPDDHPQGIHEAAMVAAVSADPGCVAHARAESCFSAAVLCAAFRAEPAVADRLARTFSARQRLGRPHPDRYRRALRDALRQSCLEEPDAAVSGELFVSWAQKIDADPGGAAAEDFVRRVTASPSSRPRALLLLKGRIASADSQAVVAGYNRLLVRVASPPPPEPAAKRHRGRGRDDS
jgi:hypothetical protein